MDRRKRGFHEPALPELAGSEPIESLDRAEITEWVTDAIFNLVDATLNDGSRFDKTDIFIRVASVVSIAVHAKPKYDPQRAGDVAKALVAKKFAGARHEI